MSYRESNFIQKYSQNEITNKKLIQMLVNQSSIKKGDIVYDIGAGSGNITAVLLKTGAKVIAIEKDKELYLKCKQMSIDQKRGEVFLTDFLEWEFPPYHRYKVFANIPFFHTADIINKLLFNENAPEDCYLIIQKEAAEKYAGIPKDTLTSLLIKPMFWVDIIYHFERNVFYPVPSVDIVLIQFEKRQCRLIPERYYGMYKDFIVFCREGSNRTIKKALKNLFTYSQIKQIFHLLGIDYRSNPAELNFMQYLCIFQFYLSNNIKNIALIQGAEARLIQQSAKRIKIHRTRNKR